MKIAIVGGGPSSKEAPWDNKDYQIWALGNQMQRWEGKRVDAIFEVHEDLSEHDHKYPQWLVDFNKPLIVSDKFPIKADHVKTFDYDKLSYIGDYFTSSPANMMAYAISLNPEEIAIAGVDMAVDDHEYFMQRPCMEMWVGYAMGKGIRVTIAKSSTLCKSSYREGRDLRKGDRGLNQGPFSSLEFLRMANEHSAEIERCNALIQTHDGAKQAYERLAKVARAKESGTDIKSLSEGIVIG